MYRRATQRANDCTDDSGQPVAPRWPNHFSNRGSRDCFERSARGTTAEAIDDASRTIRFTDNIGNRIELKSFTQAKRPHSSLGSLAPKSSQPRISTCGASPRRPALGRRTECRTARCTTVSVEEPDGFLGPASDRPGLPEAAWDPATPPRFHVRGADSRSALIASMTLPGCIVKILSTLKVSFASLPGCGTEPEGCDRSPPKQLLSA